MQTEKLEQIQQMTDAALERLSKALAEGKSDTLKQYLAMMAKFYHYSFGNQLLIAFQKPDATHVAGFNAWKKFNRFVKKGERGIVILAPITRVVGTVEEHRTDGTTDTKELRRMVNVKPVYVFDISQTDGEPLANFAQVNGDPSNYIATLKDVIASKGIELTYADNLGGALGTSSGGRIAVLKGQESAREFSVLVHELAHELLHRGDRRERTTRKIRETEAEAVAFVVCQAIGLDCSTASSDYIQLYRGDQDTLAESLDYIRNIASEIIAAITPAP